MAKITTITEEQNRQRRAVLNDALTTRGLEGDKGNLSVLCGFSSVTGRNKYKNPHMLTIEEISRLKLTDEQIVRLVRGEMPEKQTINIYLNGVEISKIAT